MHKDKFILRINQFFLSLSSFCIMIFKGKNQEILEMTECNNLTNKGLNTTNHTELSILWFLDDHSRMTIDTQNFQFSKGDILCLTEFNKIENFYLSRVRHIRFNHSFYCVVTKDEETSCKGILFYGSTELPIFQLSEQEYSLIEIAWQIFEMEMKFCDETQLEMLQMMLYRMLVIFNRIYKKRYWANIKSNQIDTIREFSFLVEKHFKSIKSVEDYASMLNKSPKTLSNFFKKTGFPSPSQIIKNRITLEAKRLLQYTDTPISDICYDLGYDDVQTFSRFFKSQTGSSPSDFRKHYLSARPKNQT